MIVSSGYWGKQASKITKALFSGRVTHHMPLETVFQSHQEPLLDFFVDGPSPNHVLLGTIEGPVWYTIYHQLPLALRGSFNPLY